MKTDQLVDDIDRRLNFLYRQSDGCLGCYYDTWFALLMEWEMLRVRLGQVPEPTEAQVVNRPVLDACCGSRMFWFDKVDPRTVFADNRREIHKLKDKSSKGGSRILVVDPDIKADFINMPFPNNNFILVVFDPPHLIRNGRSGWLAKKYGKLTESWREDLRKGFSECFRVLKNQGIFIFKWNETDIPVSQVLTLTDYKPLFGHRCGKLNKSHWLVFMKGDEDREYRDYLGEAPELAPIETRVNLTEKFGAE